MVRMWRPCGARELSESLQGQLRWRAPGCTTLRRRALRSGLGARYRPSCNTPRMAARWKCPSRTCMQSFISERSHVLLISNQYRWPWGSVGRRGAVSPRPRTLSMSKWHPNSLGLCCILQDVHPEDGTLSRAFLPAEHVLCVLLLVRASGGSAVLHKTSCYVTQKSSFHILSEIDCCWYKEIQGADQEMETTGSCLIFWLYSVHGPLCVQRSELKYGSTGCHSVSVILLTRKTWITHWDWRAIIIQTPQWCTRCCLKAPAFRQELHLFIWALVFCR